MAEFTFIQVLVEEFLVEVAPLLGLLSVWYNDECKDSARKIDDTSLYSL